jgi:hypothetical protein
MRFDDAKNDGESQPGAAGLVRGEPGGERRLLLRVRHALAGIAKLQQHRRFLSFRGGAIAGENGQPAAFRHGVSSIQSEIEEGLFQLGRIGHQFRNIRIRLAHEFDPLRL